MGNPYSAALVGLGRIAWRFDGANPSGAALTHMGAYQNNPRTRVICGISPASQDRSDFSNRYGIETCDDFEQVLEKRPEIVSICSPSASHFEQTRACLDSEVPMIWLEKPPTLSVRELDTLIDHPAYRSGKTKILVNYTRRYSQLYDRFNAIYREHLFGAPVAMQVLYSSGLEENGSHFLDLLFALLGESAPDAFLVADDQRDQPSPTFFLRFSNKLDVAVCGHDTPYHINDLVLVCEDGRVSVLSGGMTTRVEKKVESERHAGFFRLRQVESNLIPTVEFDDPFSAALVDLIAAHETNRQPLSNLVTARPTLSLIAQIRGT